MSQGVERLVRPHLAEVETFEPADPPEVMAARAGVPVERIIRLNANENPYGPSPRVAEAIANASHKVYPDPLQRKVRAALAEHTGFDQEHIITGAGSDEIIDLLFRLFTDRGDAIIDCTPTFGMYGFTARVAGAETRAVPRDELFDIDVPAVKAAIGPAVKMVFVTSPNNPTGNLASEEQVRSLLETGLMVVVDEAYHEFSGQTHAGLVREYDNLAVLRTFSKWAGIAGLRVGYGIMSPSLVDHIIDIKPPYSVSTAAEAAMLASLEDTDALMANVRLIVDERERMFSLLEGIDGVTPWPSRANYILCRFAPGRALEVFDGMAERGIFARKFRPERLRDFFRISVGTPDQTDAVVQALSDLV